jgi:hypothetical protein
MRAARGAVKAVRKVAAGRAAWELSLAMKALLLFCAALALIGGALFVPLAGKTLWARAQERGIPRDAARLTARGLRASWDFVAGLGHARPTPRPPPHSPPQVAAKKKDFFSPRAAGREGILPQPPKEKLEKRDRAALDKLVAKK